MTIFIFMMNESTSSEFKHLLVTELTRVGWWTVVVNEDLDIITYRHALRTTFV